MANHVLMLMTNLICNTNHHIRTTKLKLRTQTNLKSFGDENFGLGISSNTLREDITQASNLYKEDSRQLGIVEILGNLIWFVEIVENGNWHTKIRDFCEESNS